MSLKLLQINSVANIGSTGRIAEQIGQAAMAAGWESYIAYGRAAGNSQSELIKIGSKIDIAWHGLITRLFDMHGRGSRIATKQFIEKIKEINPDIIHLHNIHGYYLNYEILFEYLAKANIPVVWTLHDCWSMTGHCSHFDFIGCDKWKSGCLECPLLRDYPKSFFDASRHSYELKRNSFNIDNLHIIPVSEWLSGVVKQSYLSKHFERVIYNGVDVNIFRPIASDVKTQLGINNQYMLLGVATTWDRRKGLNDYYRLAEVLPEEYQIVLVGLTAEQIRKLPPRIIGIERTNSVQELAAYYAGADIVMNLSYAETFGLTTMEGFSCGTPSIVYNVTASPELITPDTGAVVSAGDIERVKNAVEAVCKRGKSHYSPHCRQRAMQHFNKEDKFNEYIELYNKILKQK